MRSLSSLLLVLALLALLGGCKTQTAQPQTALEAPIEPPAPAQVVESANATQNLTLPEAAPKNTTKPDTCVDSDGGIEVSERGTEDRCLSPLLLEEHYCVGGRLESTTTSCACSEGACVTEQGGASLSQYPALILSGGKPAVIIVVGDTGSAAHVQAALEIATSLTGEFGTQVQSKLASEVNDLDQNLIIIGTSCENELVSALSGSREPCDAGETLGQGKITLKMAAGHAYIFISGKTSDDIRKAARVLAQHNSYLLSGTDVRVVGSLAQPKLD